MSSLTAQTIHIVPSGTNVTPTQRITVVLHVSEDNIQAMSESEDVCKGYGEAVADVLHYYATCPPASA
jgi:hypothetical protein